MLFDTKERLSKWAKREIGFVRMPGNAIVEMMDSSTHWALNVGTEYYKEFTPDEIKWLKSSLEESKTKEIILKEETKVFIGEPAKIPDGLIDSFKKAAVRNEEVRETYLAQVYYVREGEQPHLALVLRLDPVSKSVVGEIRNDFAIASRGYLGEGEYIDIHIDDGTVTPNEIIKTVGPFYTRKK
jgi:SseB protein C-terminal domain/SseB protein N-terminal domain